jgi:hypothetical protein
MMLPGLSSSSCAFADRVKQLRKGGPTAGKAAATAAAESMENSDPNEERRVSKELCLQDVVFPIDDNMSSGGDDFLPQVDSVFHLFVVLLQRWVHHPPPPPPLPCSFFTSSARR